MGHGYAKCPQNLALSNTWTQQLECQKWENVNFFGIVLQYHLTCKMALQHYAKTKQYILIHLSPSPSLSLSLFTDRVFALSSLLSCHCQASLFLSKSPSRYHQASAECRFTLTHLQIPLPIHSSHKPNILDTHLTFHFIILSFSSNHHPKVTKPHSFFPNHQAATKCRFTLTNLQIPLPIHSSHKPNILDTHLTFHSIILSSN